MLLLILFLLLYDNRNMTAFSGTVSTMKNVLNEMQKIFLLMGCIGKIIKLDVN